MSQVARNLVEELDGFLLRKKYLIHDRDPLHTRDFRARLRSAGVEAVRLPARGPNLNAYAERFVGGGLGDTRTVSLPGRRS
jgi:transposase InsO family protein